VAVTKIFSSLQRYQTLVREIATPKLPSFVNTCLQLIKPPASGQPLRLPSTVVETVVSALATIVPLYPTTLRPFSAQIRSAVRGYVAPTSSDDTLAPQPLRQASRSLLISLHYTAPKNGDSEEWAKAIDSFIKECHRTADQVFRAVNESWESTVGYLPGTISHDGEPSGGSPAAEDLPAWSGLPAGAERLAGLLELLAAFFRCPTKSPVPVPLASLMDLVSRVGSVMPPGPGREDRLQLNASIGREEKDELWSVLPNIHVAVLELLLSMVHRLGTSITSVSRDMLDQTVRIFKTTNHIPSARSIVYTLTQALLSQIGPTLDKLAVDSLTPLLQATCRDLLQSAGYLNDTAPAESQPAPNGTKKSHSTGNADAFLNPSATSTTSPIPPLDPTHLHSARTLLSSLLSHLPQQHLTPDSRGLLDRTAILTADKRALLASVLNPFRDSSGRPYASVMPFLARAFPRDLEVQVLRANLRSVPAGGGSNGMVWETDGGVEGMLETTAAEEEEPVAMFGGLGWGREGEVMEGAAIAPFVPPGMEADPDGGRVRLFGTVVEERTVAGASERAPMSPLKRKGESLDSGKAKKVESEPVRVDEDDDGSDSDEGSVQIDMTMDDDEEEEDDDDNGGGD
jgi:hypothetical protein